MSRAVQLLMDEYIDIGSVQTYLTLPLPDGTPTGSELLQYFDFLRKVTIEYVD